MVCGIISPLSNRPIAPIVDRCWFLQGKRKKSSSKPQGPKKVNESQVARFCTQNWLWIVEGASCYHLFLSLLQPWEFCDRQVRQEAWPRRSILQSVWPEVPNRYQLWVDNHLMASVLSTPTNTTFQRSLCPRGRIFGLGRRMWCSCEGHCQPIWRTEPEPTERNQQAGYSRRDWAGW